MRKNILLILILSSAYLIQAGKVKLITYDEKEISTKLLFGTDSYLYIWTGAGEFDPDELESVSKIEFKDIRVIELTAPICWGDGIRKVLPYTLVTGGLIALGLANDPYVSSNAAISVFFMFNFFVALPVGGLISLSSNIPDVIKDPAKRDFPYLQKKLKKHFLLKEMDQKLIRKIILQVDK